MSGEIWRSEVVTYGFMILNVVVVAVGFVWAWRRGMLDDLDDTARAPLRPDPKENGNG